MKKLHTYHIDGAQVSLSEFLREKSELIDGQEIASEISYYSKSEYDQDSHITEFCNGATYSKGAGECGLWEEITTYGMNP